MLLPEDDDEREPDEREPDEDDDAERIELEHTVLALELETDRLESRSLEGFVKLAWRHVEPEQPLSWNWHLSEMCQELEISLITLDYRGIFNVPPGTMKSLLVSVFFRAWIWTRRPSFKFLTGSYAAHLSLRDNEKLRDLVNSQWYQSRWPGTKIKGDKNAKELFATTAGGWSFATSVGGAGTGEHPDVIIIDDPLTAQDARSDAILKAANAWIERTLSTRGVIRGSRMYLIMQRLHQKDTTGYLASKGGWKHFYFPMRFITRRVNLATQTIEYEPSPRDRRSEEGELLWPTVFTEQKVTSLELALGPYGAAGQLQQQPAPEGGGLFQRHWFAYVDAVPAKARRCRGWDTAGTENDGDWTVGVRIAFWDGIYYIESVVRDRVGPKEVDDLIYNTAEGDGPECAQREEKEGGSAGIAVIKSRATRLARFDYLGVVLGADKLVRAKAFRTQCAAGNVKLVRGEWNETYLQELEFFPVGTWDDQVDASSCAFNSLVMEEPVCTEATWGR